MHNDHNQPVRTPPSGMPAQAPHPDQHALRGKPKAHSPMPEQRKVTDEEVEVKQPSRFMKILRWIGLALLLILALVSAYLFLLLGEPDEEIKYLPKVDEETIAMSMGALEVPGASNVENLADTFGEAVLSLGQGLSMQKARVYDTAFQGGYARRVTLTYAFDDGQTLMAESIRPTAAVTLLQGKGYELDAFSLYTLGGLNAARMDNDTQVCVFGQSDTAVYAVICPKAHAEELTGLLRYTMLVPPSAEN